MLYKHFNWYTIQWKAIWNINSKTVYFHCQNELALTAADITTVTSWGIERMSLQSLISEKYYIYMYHTWTVCVPCSYMGSEIEPSKTVFRSWQGKYQFGIY